MYQHLSNFTKFNDSVKLFELSDINSKEIHLHNVVVTNSEILDYNNKWDQLSYLVVHFTKTLSPEINVILKASQELERFRWSFIWPNQLSISLITQYTFYWFVLVFITLSCKIQLIF